MSVKEADAEARPVILTVDDDPGVSRAVARDLRRRYGGRNRIVRAESAADGLDALRKMKLRGEQAAVLLADYRMPRMNGIEFLEEAMDIYPTARRVLLTAYADTSAAIDAINVVDLDHYLLKPWDPPEEKLYPVVDDLMRTWRTTGKPLNHETHETRVVGHRWSASSAEMREFLARNQVPYRWYSSDSPEGVNLLEVARAESLAGSRTESPAESREAGAGTTELPLVITPDGTALFNPGPAELAAKVGLATLPEQDFYDLVIVGGGPAGLGSAVYAASEGLRTVLVEKIATGGQAGQSSRIENYLGFPDGLSGGQLTDRARRQASKFGAEVLTTTEAGRLEVNGAARTVVLPDDTRISAHAVILATGVSYTQLTQPGCAELTGRGIYYGSALTQAEGCAGQDVYVVGGANSAGQAAVYLSRFAKSVTMLVRASTLTPMSAYLAEQIEASDAIAVRTRTEVVEAHGEQELEALTVMNMGTYETETVDATRMFVFIGAAPRTGWLDGVVARDRRGFILTGPDLKPADLEKWPLARSPYHLETSVPGVFAAGDVHSESAKRVASAVGEGGMAVMLVHRYLEKLL